METVHELKDLIGKTIREFKLIRDEDEKIKCIEFFTDDDKKFNLSFEAPEGHYISKCYILVDYDNEKEDNITGEKIINIFKDEEYYSSDDNIFSYNIKTNKGNFYIVLELSRFSSIPIINLICVE